MTNGERFEAILNALEEFELDWYKKHPEGSYTDTHYSEFKAAKLEYLNGYMKEWNIAEA